MGFFDVLAPYVKYILPLNCFLAVLLIRLYLITPGLYQDPTQAHVYRAMRDIKKRTKPAKLVVVLGSGGHTSEMLQLLQNLDFVNKYAHRTYVVAENDELSMEKARAFEAAKPSLMGSEKKKSSSSSSSGNVSAKAAVEGFDFEFRRVRRLRNVGESWYVVPHRLVLQFLADAWFLVRTRPDVVLCNGPGTSVPIALASYVPRALWIKWISLMYVESAARVKTISLAGAMIYPIADRFFVQWPELQKAYERSEYRGLLV
ncbi:Alg14-domain-containing protein [Ramicandelaber brevisporus]|nr:Alg14-domain-containing protein [Ramicandelaber brevisporus]